MKSHHRPFIYESADFKRMCALVVQDNASKKESFVWHVARLIDWKYSLFNFKRRFPGNYATAAHLWFNYYDDLIGFVISEEFDERFEIMLLEEYSYLYPDVLMWVKSEWGMQYSGLITYAVETHRDRITALEQAGYQRTSDIEMVRIFDTSLFSDHPYPTAPFSFQSMAENKNYANQTLLRRSAWSHHTVDQQSDDAIRAYLRTSPMVIRSRLRALHENHIATAYLTGWDDKTIHLYGKLGHVKEFARFSYRLDMTG